MAMQLDLRKWVEEKDCAIQRTERTKKEREIKQALLEDQQQNFAKPLLYGGQCEHPNRSLPFLVIQKNRTARPGARVKHPRDTREQGQSRKQARGATMKSRSRTTTKARSNRGECEVRTGATTTRHNGRGNHGSQQEKYAGGKQETQASTPTGTAGQNPVDNSSWCHSAHGQCK
jgi:hypothetical protein